MKAREHQRRVAYIVTACCIITAPSALQAQAATTTRATLSPALAAVDSLIASSRFRDARAALDRWESENSNTVRPTERASAMLLRARLIQDADSARDAYLSLSLSYPSSPEAAVSLLRLGQIAFTAGDNARAASYFQRIVSDHPTSAVRSEANDWLARTKTPARATPSRATPPALPAAANDGAFTLQVGAFRSANTAATVVRQLEKAGFTARAVRVPANDLVRVRVGRFATSRAADDTMKRLRTAGYEAIVVDDARAEAAASN